MASDTYLEHSEETGPAWGSYYQEFRAAIAQTADVVAEGIAQATLQRFPRLCAEDGLGIVARERGIVRGLSESLASWRERVRNAFTRYEYAGTRKAIVDAFADVGLPGVKVFTDSESSWDTYSGTMPNRFWVVFPAGTHSFPDPARWGSGTYNQIGVYASSMTPAQKAFYCSLVDKWKPAHAYFMGFVIVFSGTVYGSAGLYGSGTYGGSATFEAC